MGVLIAMHDWSGDPAYWTTVNHCFDGLQLLGGEFNYLVVQPLGRKERAVALARLPRFAKEGTTFECLHAFDLFDLSKINLREFRSMFMLQFSPLMGRFFYLFSERGTTPADVMERDQFVRWLSFWRGCYGYMKQCRLEDDPVGIALSSGLKGSLEGYKRSTNWFVDRRETKTYLQTRFRQVFEINFIRESHLTQKLEDGKNLADWVAANSANGLVMSITDDMFAWCAPPDQLDRINNYLRRQEIVIC